jgi:glycerol uptake facilitator-like aquaporin
MTLSRRLAAEAAGTAFLLTVIVGSGIMGERLAGGNAAIALLANSIATGCGLWVLITLFAPVSGAHFNPAVTLAFAGAGDFPWRDVSPYLLVQIIAAYVGVAAAHLMFELPLFTASEHVRAGPSQWWSEVVATGGLLMTIWLGARVRPQWVAGLVAVYITGAYWFTGSTSFANPAVTLARAATNTFAGIRPADVPWFVIAELVGALIATAFARWLLRVPP